MHLGKLEQFSFGFKEAHCDKDLKVWGSNNFSFPLLSWPLVWHPFILLVFVCVCASAQVVIANGKALYALAHDGNTPEKNQSKKQVSVGLCLVGV